MFFRLFRNRSVWITTLAACAFCIGSYYMYDTNSVTASTSTSTFLFSNLAVYRNLGDDRFEVDGTPVMELAREIVGDDAGSNVSFDKATQCLIVTSTAEKLERIKKRFHNMYRAIGVELRPASNSEIDEIYRNAARISADELKR